MLHLRFKPSYWTALQLDILYRACYDLPSSLVWLNSPFFLQTQFSDWLMCSINPHTRVFLDISRWSSCAIFRLFVTSCFILYSDVNFDSPSCVISVCGIICLIQTDCGESGRHVCSYRYFNFFWINIEVFSLTSDVSYVSK